MNLVLRSEKLCFEGSVDGLNIFVFVFSLWAGETQGLQKVQSKTVRDREALL